VKNEATQIKAVNIFKAYNKQPVVKSVSFSVNLGEVVGLLGPNGAGKTTSFYMMVGLLFPDTGQVFLGEEDITTLPMYKRGRRGISYLPQNSSIFRKLTVEENLLAIMEVVKTPRTARKQLLLELLDQFQIGGIAKSLGATLSGGERRRVEIARALIGKPSFLLLDEPFAGIDPVTVQEIQGIITSLVSERLGVLITDHNVRETLASCSRAYVLAEGQIIAHGNAEAILNNPLVKEKYLGNKFVL
jgi:lipopolysaccharide export system ATP-binding protein